MALALVNSPGWDCYTSAAAFLTAGSGTQIFLAGSDESCSERRRELRARPEARVCGSLTGGRSTGSVWGRVQLIDEPIWGFEPIKRPLQTVVGGFLAPAVTATSEKRFGPGILTGKHFCMLTSAVGTGSAGGGSGSGTDGCGLQAAAKNVVKDIHVDGGTATATTRDEPFVTAAPDELSKMKLVDLKALYRDNGGKPGALRKAELVERLRRSFQAQTAVTGAGSPNALASETLKTGDLFEADTATATKLPSTVDESGVSSPTRPGEEPNYLTSEQLLSLPADEAGSDLTMPSPGDPSDLLSSPSRARTALDVEVEQDFPEAQDDLLSQGPAAVVAAARARGAAAVAVVAKGATGGWDLSASAMTEETEARELSMAANGWVSSPEEARQHLRHQQKLLQEPEQHRAREENRQSNERKRLAKTVTSSDTVVNIAAEHARSALSVASPSSTSWRNRVFRDSKHRSDTGPGMELEPGRGRGEASVSARSRGGARPPLDRLNPLVTRGSGMSRKYRSGGSPVSRGGGGRPRLMPKMPNPWARGGQGGASEGLPAEGDVVDEYLADLMVQASDKERGASGDPIFDRSVGWFMGRDPLFERPWERNYVV